MVCSQSRSARLCACTPRRVRRASLSSSATQKTTWPCGRNPSRASLRRPVSRVTTRRRLFSATVCLRVVLVCTTGLRTWASQSYLHPRAIRSGSLCFCRISNPPSSWERRRMCCTSRSSRSSTASRAISIHCASGSSAARGIRTRCVWR